MNAAESHEESYPKQTLRLWIKLLNTTTVVEKIIRAHLKSQFESTLPRFDVLAALDRSDEPLTMTELSQRLLVSNGNVTGLVARLVEDGLLVRQVDAADRRTQRVSLTPEGKRFFAAMAVEHQDLVSRIFDNVSDSEIARLLRLVTKLNKSIEDNLSRS